MITLLNKCLPTLICFMFQKFVTEFSSFYIAFKISLLINGLRFPLIAFCLRCACFFNISVQIMQKFKNSFSSREMDWVSNLTLREFKISFILKFRARKFYIRRNNNKVDSIETGRIVIVHLLP